MFCGSSIDLSRLEKSIEEYFWPRSVRVDEPDGADNPEALLNVFLLNNVEF